MQRFGALSRLYRRLSRDKPRLLCVVLGSSLQLDIVAFARDLRRRQEARIVLLPAESEAPVQGRAPRTQDAAFMITAEKKPIHS